VSYSVTLQASGKRFTVAVGESVLDAARRAGLALPYSCLSGVCGSCKATLISGECHYPRNPPNALNAAEVARHQVLLCQAVPLSDLVIGAREVASVADLPRRVLALKLSEQQRLAPDVMRLVLQPAHRRALVYLAGQYLDVLLPAGRRRAFSIANAPHTGPQIELHVRHVAGGDFTNFVFNELAIGDVLRVEGPLGTFVPREDSERPMIFVAGGTGFAPVKALIEHFLHLGTRRPMMAAFLDAVGVKHDDGRIDTEANGPIEVAPERFRAAADDLARSFPADEVVTYFLTVLLQDYESWKPAVEWLESVGAA